MSSNTHTHLQSELNRLIHQHEDATPSLALAYVDREDQERENKQLRNQREDGGV